MLSTTPRSTAAATGPSLGFSDQRSEIVVDALPVEGRIPEWLTGSLLRNGPAQWDLADGGAVNHWFDGMAMLHRFAFSGGRVGYRNKLLRGRAAQAYEATGQIAFREFATDPCRSAFGRVMAMFDPGFTDNAAVNITRIGERWLAITETPMAVEFDPQTLETLGVRRMAKGARVPVAHPHVDASRAELIGLRVAMGVRPKYEVTATDLVTDTERPVASIPVRHPAYQHSFAVTERHVIISEHPFVVEPRDLVFGGRPFIDNYRWEPERGTRYTAVDRGTGEVTGRWTGPADFCFHHVNAFDEADGSIVADLAVYDDATVIDELSIGHRRAGRPVPPPTLRRVRLRPGGGEAEPVAVPHAVIELPRIDERFSRRAYTVVFGAGFAPDSDFIDRIVRVDLASGAVDHWHEPGAYPGEPVFVPRPGSDAEGDGVLLSVVLEPGRGTSSLVVLDAGTLEELGRARVPQHIPFGFHGGHSASL